MCNQTKTIIPVLKKVGKSDYIGTVLIFRGPVQNNNVCSCPVPSDAYLTLEEVERGCRKIARYMGLEEVFRQ